MFIFVIDAPCTILLYCNCCIISKSMSIVDSSYDTVIVTRWHHAHQSARHAPMIGARGTAE